MVPSSTTPHVSVHTYNDNVDNNKEYVVNADDDDDDGDDNDDDEKDDKHIDIHVLGKTEYSYRSWSAVTAPIA